MAEWNDLERRLWGLRRRIAEAAERAGRRPDEITLIAVSKTFPAEAIRTAYRAGLRDFGENYVQEFEAKTAALEELPGARFHLIGHLQSNKARRAVQLFDSIQTVDSLRLARRLEEAVASSRPERKLPVMIEVKLSPEESKAGVTPEQLSELVEALRACPHLQLTGLMTMPPYSEHAEDSRPYFRRLRALAQLYRLPQLSMGMSHDFEVAIEEGATHVRIGTALFGRRQAR